MATYYGDTITLTNPKVEWRTRLTFTTAGTKSTVNVSWAIGFEYRGTTETSVQWMLSSEYFSYSAPDNTSGSYPPSGQGISVGTTTAWQYKEITSGEYSITKRTSQFGAAVSATLTHGSSSSTASHTITIPARERITKPFLDRTGGTYTTQTAYYGYPIPKPTDPTERGYTFLGWYSDSALTQAVTFPLNVTNANPLYSAWSLTSKVYAKVNGSWVQIPKPMAKDSNGVWKECDVYVKVNGSWVKLN